jgi:hypothetical protein
MIRIHTEDFAVLVGATVERVEREEDYLVVHFDNGAALYADQPTVYVDAPVSS